MLSSDVVRGRKNPLYFGLASRLRKARKAEGLSFDSLADAARLTNGSTVFELESKRGHHPRIDTVERIAYALGLSPGFLAYGIAGQCAPVETLRGDGVGDRLRAARQSRNLSMRALARDAALTETTVRSTENGKTVPTIATVEALADALQLSPAWLAYGVGPQTLPLGRRPGTRSAAHAG